MPFDPLSFVNVTELSCCVIARVCVTCRIWGQHFSLSLPVGKRSRCVGQHVQKHHSKVVPFNFLFFYACAWVFLILWFVRRRNSDLERWRIDVLVLWTWPANAHAYDLHYWGNTHAQTYHTDNKIILLWYIYISLIFHILNVMCHWNLYVNPTDMFFYCNLHHHYRYYKYYFFISKSANGLLFKADW